jgi:hypothetical protein
MRRREFIAGLGGAADAARGHQATGKIKRLGILQPGTPPDPLAPPNALSAVIREGDRIAALGGAAAWPLVG